MLKEEEYAGTADLKVTHEQLAAHLGTVREAVSRMLKYFESEGLLELSRGTIRISDLEGLKEVAQKGINPSARFQIKKRKTRASEKNKKILKNIF